MDINQEKALAKLFASKFIARSDIMAVQHNDGEYRPTRNSRTKVITEGFSMQALLDHLRGERTLGHYMTNLDDKVKLFAIDVDIEQNGRLPRGVFNTEFIDWQQCNPREYWKSRQPGAGRDLLKIQMREIAHRFAKVIKQELGIPVAVAYSGYKGIHVYGFTGLVSADRARKGAQIVLDACGWTLSRGQNFFSHTGQDLNDIGGKENFSAELFPKQDSIDGKDLGNLMRLPLGVNRKSPRDKPFFVDLRTAMTQLSPMDPIEALNTDDPWRYVGE